MDRPPKKAFFSYAHKDMPFFEVFKEGLISHLFTSDKYDFGVWSDDNLHVGSFWDKEIQKNLAESDLAIFCVSSNFLNSKYIEAKEFGNLATAFPDTLIVPVYFNHCNIKSWDKLSERQFFKPTGDDYNMAIQKDFSFCNLVQFRTDGKPNPNSHRELYFKHLVKKIEDALEHKFKKAKKQKVVSGKHIPNYITNNYPYFEKDSFFGRDELLSQIDNKIKTLDVPLLLSGIGGMGKTAVAIAYGKDPAYNTAYDHIAWIDVTENIFSNLLSIFHSNPVIPFEYSPEGDRVKDIAYIMQLLKQAPGNNLLLVDNANDEKDLRDFVNAWKKYQPGWKSMLTTRCDNNAYKNHLLKLHEISLEAAEDLFKQHNNEEFDKESFKAIYKYIGGHTFLIELLAKFGQESSIINGTAEILSYLEKTKGVKALNTAVIAKQGHQEEKDKQVSEFVMGLYNPLVLPEKEQEYLRYFSILPATDIEFGKLVYFFGIEESEEGDFNNLLNSLFKIGWLIRNANFFKCHQIIKEICNEKLKPNAENCDILINRLVDFFKGANTTQAVPYFEMGLSVIDNIKDISWSYALLQSHLSDRIIETGNFTDSLTLLQNGKKIYSELKEETAEAICLERIGTIYWLRGNRDAALNCFIEYNNIEKSLVDKNPENLIYKNGLAISFGKLGNIYQADGNIEEALNCFKEFNDIEKSLSDKDPENLEYKNNLAMSFGMLGDFYKAEGNTKEALNYLKECNIIEKSLSDKNPENLEYKNGLAISFSKLGDIYQADGNIEEALNCFIEYNNIEKSLFDKNPENLRYKNSLAISFCRLGDIYQAEGKMEEALNCYKEDMKITKSLSDKNPESVEYKNNIAISYTTLARFSTNDEKKDYYLLAKEIWEKLLIKVPQNAGYKKNLDWVNNKLKEFE